MILERPKLDRGPSINSAGENCSSASLDSAGSSPDLLSNAFGITDHGLAKQLLGQIVNVVHSGSAHPIAQADIDHCLAAVRAIAPVGGLEAMIATLLVASHFAALDAMRRATHPAQTAPGRQSYSSLALKAMRTHAQLSDTLMRGRGTGSTQQIIVKHLSVKSGGQAVLGPFSRGRGGDATP
jgi:hypothetical protein